MTGMICSLSFKNSHPGKKTEAMTTTNSYLVLRQQIQQMRLVFSRMHYFQLGEAENSETESCPSDMTLFFLALSTSIPTLCQMEAVGLAYFKGELVIGVLHKTP